MNLFENLFTLLWPWGFILLAAVIVGGLIVMRHRKSSRSIPSGAATPEKIYTGVQRVVSLLKENGIRISPSSRFGKYERIIKLASTSGKIDDPLLPQALMEFKQLEIISVVYGTDPNIRGKLQGVIKDPIDPQNSKPETPGRDSQFELYMAALLTLGGCSPIFAEPDIVVDLDGAVVGIAAKRVKSKGTLRERISNAIDQIERQSASGRINYGVVALELTYLVNPEGQVEISDSDDLKATAAKNLAEQIFGITVEGIKSVMRDHSADLIAGVFFHVSAIQIHPHLGAVITARAFRSITFGTQSADILHKLKACVMKS